MAGISGKAENFGLPENKIKYNGIEFESDLDLIVYDAFYRELDPQTGKWWEIDPKAERFLPWSPFNLNYDNPIKFSDPLGDNPILRALAKNGVKWASKTVKEAFKPISRENALKLLKQGKSVYSTGENTAKNSKKLMKEAADGKKIVRHDGHELSNGKNGQDHFQKKSGDGSHVFYSSIGALTITPGSPQEILRSDNNFIKSTKLITNSISISLNPGGAILEFAGKATGLNQLGRNIIGNNAVGQFVDDWLNPLN